MALPSTGTRLTLALLVALSLGALAAIVAPRYSGSTTLNVVLTVAAAALGFAVTYLVGRPGGEPAETRTRT